MYPSERASPSAPKTEPILVNCQQRIRTRIDSCFEASTRIENVIDRLLNSTPRPVEDQGTAKPPVSTVEASFNELDGYAEHLSKRLHDLAERLERAA